MARTVNNFLVTIALFLSLSGCTSGVFFAFENLGEDVIEIRFTLSEDLRLHGDEQEVKVTLDPGQRHTIRMSAQAAFNRNDPGLRRDYIEIDTFLSYFNALEIRNPGTDDRLDISDIGQDAIAYDYPPPSSIVYILGLNAGD